MPARISKVTLVLETWNSDITWGSPPQYVKRRVSFEVPVTDAAFYDAAHERWAAFSEAMWNGGKQFNDVTQDDL